MHIAYNILLGVDRKSFEFNQRLVRFQRQLDRGRVHLNCDRKAGCRDVKLCIDYYYFIHKLKTHVVIRIRSPLRQMNWQQALMNPR